MRKMIVVKNINHQTVIDGGIADEAKTLGVVASCIADMSGDREHMLEVAVGFFDLARILGANSVVFVNPYYSVGGLIEDDGRCGGWMVEASRFAGREYEEAFLRKEEEK